MKYRRSFGGFCIILVLLFLAGCDRNRKEATVLEPIASGEDMNIYVATDIHYLSRNLQDDGAAFQKYYKAGDGKQLNYSEEIVDSFLYEIETTKPEILVISGDLTNNGEKESHRDLAAKLSKIEATANTRVFVIPGNHDIQNPWARGFQGEEQYVTDSISSSEFEEIYQEFGYSEAISRDANSLSYLAAPSEDVWLLMLDTCVYENNYKYGSPASYGQITEETYEWIKECSKLAKENNARIVTSMHHNLLNHNLLLTYGFTLDQNDAAIKVFRECGIDLVLSGHVHMQDIKSSKEELDPIYDIATSSLLVYPVQYGKLIYQPGHGFDYSTAQVDVEGWAKKNRITDDNVLQFEAYNKEFFGSISSQRAYDSLTETGLYSEEEKQLMIETMSLLNLNYFAGTMSLIRDQVIETKGYELWRSAKEPEGLTDYIHSLLYDYKMDNNTLFVPE